MQDAKTFGRRIKEAREKKELNQKQLAEKLDITPQALSSYETGKKLPPMETTVNIAKELDISLDWLFGLPERSAQAEISTLADVVELIEKIAEYEFLCSDAAEVSYFPGGTDSEQIAGIRFDGVDIERQECFDPDCRRFIDVCNSKETVIRIRNEELYDYFDKRRKVLKLLNDGTLDTDFYSSWLAGEKEKLRQHHLLSRAEWLSKLDDDELPF